MTFGLPAMSKDDLSRRPTAEAGTATHDELRNAVANFKQFDGSAPAKTADDSTPLCSLVSSPSSTPSFTRPHLPPVREPIKLRSPEDDQPLVYGDAHALPVLDAAWVKLNAAMDTFGAAEDHGCIGAAAGHAKAARMEAASKVLVNHTALLQDICSPSDTTNIVGNPLTQRELVRVGAEYAAHVDEGLREACRRLLGLEEPRVLHTAKEAIEARAACARYLAMRIQANTHEKPGRPSDIGMISGMSPAAAAAMKAVLVEVGTTAWEPLQVLFNARGVCELERSTCLSVAADHTPAARLEAATRLLANHFNMLVDVTNPKPVEQSIEDTPLAQVQLTRVHPEHAPHVDEMLREVAHRLMGWGEPRLVSGAPEAMQARVACAHSLLGWGEPKLVSAASAANPAPLPPGALDTSFTPAVGSVV